MNKRSNDPRSSLQDKAFLVLLVATSVAFAWILQPYYGALFWAAALAILFAPLQRRLQCELEGRSRSQCSQPVAAAAALRRLLVITLAPAVLMLLGGLLLLRQLWLWRQGRLAPVPPLQGPELSLIDVTLVVAGGFVVLGELVTPLLLGPLLTRALGPLA
ncbi:MAG: hypothetical protein EBU07_17475, partial [Betaproteobacteria bacterium]|nr:hypothetical protein [Betaproteobacteria bacterium]